MQSLQPFQHSWNKNKACKDDYSTWCYLSSFQNKKTTSSGNPFVSPQIGSRKISPNFLSFHPHFFWFTERCVLKVAHPEYVDDWSRTRNRSLHFVALSFFFEIRPTNQPTNQATKQPSILKEPLDWCSQGLSKWLGLKHGACRCIYCS